MDEKAREFWIKTAMLWQGLITKESEDTETEKTETEQEKE